MKPQKEAKKDITISLSKSILNALEKRAKKNLFSLSEQIEDIVRRSCSNVKKLVREEKLDDKLVGLFSRKKR